MLLGDGSKWMFGKYEDMVSEDERFKFICNSK